MTEKKINIFTYINQIQSKRKSVPFDKKIAGSFLLSLFLSMNKDYIRKVNEINKYQFVLSDEAVYEYYMGVIPQGKSYSKFVKKRKGDDKEKDRIEKIQKMYPDMSVRECKMLLSFLTRRS